MIRNIKDIRECPDCASVNIIHRELKEQVICRDCGLIFEPMAPALEARFEKSHGMKTALVKAPKKKVKKKKAVKKAKKKKRR